MTQRLSFLSSLLIYLESERLATRAEVADMLGSEVISIRDVLHGDPITMMS